jgi:catechol 2,3-dioxygenase-like lactoylglutathione lyase family enzyme
MKVRPLLFGTGFLLATAAFPTFSDDTPKRATEGSDGAALAKPPLRRPGFVFVELGTPRIDDYVAFFQDVAGFRLIRKEPRYAELESEFGELLLFDPQGLPQGHPFHGKLSGSGQGLGVEIGLVVADLDKSYAAALTHAGWKISLGIGRRPWGVRDFRVLAPDGYYLRLTEGPAR